MSKVTKIEIVGPFQMIQYRTTTEHLDEDGNVVGQTHERAVLAPNEVYQGDSPQVAALAAAIHTEELAAEYTAHLQKQQDEQDALIAKRKHESAALEAAEPPEKGEVTIGRDDTAAESASSK